MNDFGDVIDKLGGPAAFARKVGMSAGAAKQAQRRKSLNARWFSATVEAARREGIVGITLTSLAALASSDRLAA